MTLAVVFTSTFAGATGLGGGLMLLSVLPNFLPATAIIPLHAVTQWVSNASRLSMGLKHLDKTLVRPLIIGAIAGASLGASLYSHLPTDYLPPLLGLWVLWLTWMPQPRVPIPEKFTFVFLGFYQSAISMALGATGPLGTALLMRHSKDREYLVINTALYMSISHTCRVTAFTLLGFSFVDWWLELAILCSGAVLGSWLGTQIRPYIRQEIALTLLKGILTILALKLIVSAAL